MSPNDWISELPDEIIVDMLSQLKMKEMVQTSVFSKRWRHLWTTMRNLNFESKEILHDLVVERHHLCTIYQLRIQFIVDFSLEVTSSGNIDSWVSFDLRKRVQRLKLDLRHRYGVYIFPHSMETSSCTSLTFLKLFGVNKSGQVFEVLLCNCRKLEFVYVSYSQTLANLNVDGPSLKLKWLELHLCARFVRINLSAPNLVSFKYSGFMLIPQLIDLPKLVETLTYDACANENVQKYMRFPEFTKLKYLNLEFTLPFGHILLDYNNLIKAAPSLYKLTVQNYGPKFDTVGTGILRPVQLVGRKDNETIIKDLSKNIWSCKIGLNGVDSMLQTSNKTGPAAADSKWQSNDLPIFRMMTWYKTSFKAPLGTDPVALYLQGLGKGFAWVNGHSIGRYFPNSVTEDNGCSLEPCDYRGRYDNNKCVANCGLPTQSLYHVPRSFLSRDENTLVWFEEFGGNPSLVSFNTVVPGSVCGNVYENKTLELSCQGRSIKAISFAAFGEVHGSCGSFRAGSCQGENNAKIIIENACLGKETCSVAATEDVFGGATEAATCVDLKKKKLAVEAVSEIYC